MTDACDDLEGLGSAWLDGELPPSDAAAVDAHVRACDDCRAALDDLSRTRALLRSLPVRRVPDGLLEDVPADAGDPVADVAPRTTVPPVPPVPATGRPATGDGRSRARARSRTTAAAVALLGVLGGAAFALGDRPPDARTVRVPVDLFVADHVARTIGTPVGSPMLLEASP